MEVQQCFPILLAGEHEGGGAISLYEIVQVSMSFMLTFTQGANSALQSFQVGRTKFPLSACHYANMNQSALYQGSTDFLNMPLHPKMFPGKSRVSQALKQITVESTDLATVILIPTEQPPLL